MLSDHCVLKYACSHRAQIPVHTADLVLSRLQYVSAAACCLNCIPHCAYAMLLRAHNTWIQCLSMQFQLSSCDFALKSGVTVQPALRAYRQYIALMRTELCACDLQMLLTSSLCTYAMMMLRDLQAHSSCIRHMHKEVCKLHHCTALAGCVRARCIASSCSNASPIATMRTCRACSVRCIKHYSESGDCRSTTHLHKSRCASHTASNCTHDTLIQYAAYVEAITSSLT
jgi:hypothetical protein